MYTLQSFFVQNFNFWPSLAWKWTKTLCLTYSRGPAAPGQAGHPCVIMDSHSMLAVVCSPLSNPGSATSYVHCKCLASPCQSVLYVITCGYQVCSVRKPHGTREPVAPFFNLFSRAWLPNYAADWQIWTCNKTMKWHSLDVSEYGKGTYVK